MDTETTHPIDHEEVFFHGHPSWRSILGFYIKGILVALVAGVVAGLASAAADKHVHPLWVAPAVLVILIGVVLGGLIKRIQTTYTITSQRLTIQTGIISRELHETRLERVQNVNSLQSLLERMLRIGTVDFDTAAGAEYDFSFRGVAHPREIVRTVDRAIHDLHRHGQADRGDRAL